MIARILWTLLRGIFIPFLFAFWYLEAIFRVIVLPRKKSIDGETILVTGAAGGIGRELCLYLARSGKNIKLVIWDINLGSLNTLTAELEAQGTGTGLTVYTYQVDISSLENIQAGFRQIKESVGCISILFNNAGIQIGDNFLQLTMTEITTIFQVNFFSQLWIIRNVLPSMVANKHGRIVNICSVGGLIAGPNTLPYCASKFAVNGYTESLRAELSHYNCQGVFLTSVFPYFVQTPLIKSLAIKDGAGSSVLGCFRKFLTPKYVAQKTVDGMRREYQHVYMPTVIPWVLFFSYLLPFKVKKVLRSVFQSMYVFMDATDQRRYAHNSYQLSTGNTADV